MKIDWIVEGISNQPDGGYTSALASNRYRVIAPAAGLRQLGHQVRFLSIADASAATGDLPDALIVGKLLPGNDHQAYRAASARVLDLASRLRSQGVAVLADFNDDHFDHPVVGPHWRGLASVVSASVVGSEAMGEAVRRHSKNPTHVIGDPLGSTADVPRVFRRASGKGLLNRMLPGRARERISLAWYGNPVNLPALQRWAEQLASIAARQSFVLWVVTRVSDGLTQWADLFNAKHAPAAAIEVVPWDEETQWSVVRDADVVLVPSDPADPKKAVKTSNRVADALNAGRYVIASPLPSYLPFSSMAALTDDPVAALDDYLADPDAALHAIMRGQGAAQAMCSANVIAQAWARTVESSVAAVRTGQVPPAEAPASAGTPSVDRPVVRLNLGCGDKILDGYVNVDVVESRAGKRPDVLCDLHKLEPFEDGCADEVMAIHVVEHFWRWEVEDILREWVRVLRPGGRMILECPNLISACEEFLRDPDRRSQQTQEGQRTMWVFYGDPAWKDPYMIHRWGYTPRSLGELMAGVGLVNVRQEPAQYKLREPRDMRLVGEKPAF